VASTLTPEQAKAFYDRFGAKQDWQGFYENPARRDLIAHADFGSATSVYEFGCGTGDFAARLLAEHLPPRCSYTAIDISETMVRLARTHLEPWRDRARVDRSSGSMALEAADGAFDRFVSTYVLDLLSDEDIRGLLAEAHRILSPGGRLCLAGLARGTGPIASLVTRMWETLHAWRPALVGGCRPIDLRDYLDPGRWTIEHRAIKTAFGIASEVMVARRLAGEEAPA
jgi:ubiquinone/menaquinone biosynthesis C-methylase UbiE